MDTWLLLVYTVPTEPSRKRAYVWREIKKVGAVYLRDGVCALPERAETTAAARAIVAKIEEFEGHATLVQRAQIDPAPADALRARFRAARADEYREVIQAAEGLLEHVRRETEHRDFSFAELEELEADLDKLRRWREQIRARDYFGAEEAGLLDTLLVRCEEALGAFLEEASGREVHPR